LLPRPSGLAGRGIVAPWLGIAGASYGGYAVDWILGQTDRFAAAVTHDGVFNLESEDLTYTRTVLEPHTHPFALKARGICFPARVFA
jgi:hypothetical protein